MNEAQITETLTAEWGAATTEAAIATGDLETLAKRAAEAIAARGAGHLLVCFEDALERLVEAAAEQGVELAGDLDEVWQCQSLDTLAELWLGDGRAECGCPVIEDEA